MAKVLFVDSVDAYMTRSIPSLVVVHAAGRTSTLGWHDARLEPYVYVAPPADGIMDLDFQATPPSGNIQLPSLGIAAASTTFEKPAWCKGIRVHAAANVMEDSLYPLEGASSDLAPQQSAAEGDSFIPIPWSGGVDIFPWMVVADGAIATDALLQKAIQRGDTPNAKVSELVGKPVRIIRDGDPVTDDYRPERVNIVTKDGKIKAVYFG
jgi:hypothetical protein